MSGSVYQRNNGTDTFYMKFKSLEGVWITEKIGKVSKQEAEKALAIRQAEVFQGKFKLAEVKQKTILFEKWISEFRLSINDKSDRNRFNQIIPYFKGRHINKINLWDIERFKLQRSKIVSECETNKELKLIKRAMKAADKAGYNNAIAGSDLPLFKNVDKGNDRVMSLDEEKLMFESAGKLSFPAVIGFLTIGLNTGCRPKEIFYLKFDDIDFKKNILTVYQHKVKEKKIIPMNETLKNYLIIQSNERKGIYILTNTDKPFNYRTFHHAWDKVRSDCKLDAEIIPYCLRHTFCTRLSEAGIPLRRIMLYSGHKTLAMVQRYTHPESSEEDLKILDFKSTSEPKIKQTENCQAV